MTPNPLTRDYLHHGPWLLQPTGLVDSAGRLVTRLEVVLAVAAINLETKADRRNRQFREGNL